MTSNGTEEHKTKNLSLVTESHLQPMPRPPQSPSEDDAESTIYVPIDMMDNPLGFVNDAGSSVLKLIYRSNLEYSNGKLIKPISGLSPDQGLLHLRSFNMSQINGIEDFLKDRVDIAIETEKRGTTWWLTGITTQHVKKRIEDTLEIKTKLFSEMMALGTYFQHFKKMNIGFYETNTKAVEFARQTCLNFHQIYTRWEKLGDTTCYPTSTETKESQELLLLNCDGVEKNAKPSEDTNSSSINHEAKISAETLLFGNDSKTWTEDYTHFTKEIESPALLIHMGSACCVGLIDENFKLTIVDHFPGGGKTLCGLAEQLTGEKNFNNFVKMAERGQMEKVHLRICDVMDLGRSDDDWYTGFPGDAVAFELGKLASSNMIDKASYNKEDLAYGILEVNCKNLAKMTTLCAKLHNVKSIIFSGSMVKYRLIREFLERNLLMDILMNNIKGAHLTKLHFLHHPGLICAIGVWWTNVNEEKNRKKVKEQEKNK